jgi:hypothetical protein
MDDVFEKRTDRICSVKASHCEQHECEIEELVQEGEHHE